MFSAYVRSEQSISQILFHLSVSTSTSARVFGRRGGVAEGEACRGGWGWGVSYSEKEMISVMHAVNVLKVGD